jgi:hypothetical protein
MRKFSASNLPDPKDQTPNTPAIILSAEEAVSIYNDTAGVDVLSYKSRVDEIVAKHIAEFMLTLGWSNVKQYGTTFLLVADVTLTQL